MNRSNPAWGPSGSLLPLGLLALAFGACSAEPTANVPDSPASANDGTAASAQAMLVLDKTP